MFMLFATTYEKYYLRISKQIYFFSNASTAFVISSLVFGYKYPAIICPTPIAATKAPTPFKISPKKKTPKRKRPIPTERVGIQQLDHEC